MKGKNDPKNSVKLLGGQNECHKTSVMAIF